MNIKIKKQLRWYLDLIYSCKLILLKVVSLKTVKNNLDIQCDDEISFLYLTNDLIDDLMIYHDDCCIKYNFLFTKNDVINRLKMGHHCYLAIANHKVVGVSWYGINNVYSTDLDITFYIPSDYLIGYNTFVHPDYRGRKILTNIRQTAYNDLKKYGYTFILSYMLSTNQLILKAGKRFNQETIGQLRIGYFFFYHFLKVHFKKDIGLKIKRNFNSWGIILSFFTKIKIMYLFKGLKYLIKF